MLLYNRNATLFVGEDEKSATGLGIDQSFRVVFDIKKTMNTQLTPNTCKIQIYNLKEESRNKFHPLKSLIILRAGYGTNVLDHKTIFSGIAVRVSHARKPPDFITTVDVIDGFQIINGKPISFVQEKNSSLKACLKKAIEDAKKLNGLDFELGPNDFIETPDVKAGKGFIATCPAIEGIANICEQLKIDFSIQDNVIRLFTKGKGNKTAEVLSSATGMLDSPVLIEDANKDDPTAPFKLSGWQVSCELRPSIKPHDVVQIDSPTLGSQNKAQFLVQTVQHQGDTWGQDWKTIIDVLQGAK